MTDVVAKLRHGSNIFEKMVDLDNAMNLKKGKDVNITEVIRDDTIWRDLKKGMRAGTAELEGAFQTSDIKEITKKIVTRGELEVTQEYRDEELEKRKKQIIDFLLRNAVDSRTNRPFTPDTISSAIDQAGVKIENKDVDKQISNVIDKIRTIIPLKIETKKILIKNTCTTHRKSLWNSPGIQRKRRLAF